MFSRKCCNRQPNFGGQWGFGGQMPYGGSQTQPVIEPTMTNCVEKDFFCEVPHVCPKHTHTINRVHYVHTYTPQYTCSEETQVFNNDCGSCQGF